MFWALVVIGGLASLGLAGGFGYLAYDLSQQPAQQYPADHYNRLQ